MVSPSPKKPAHAAKKAAAPAVALDLDALEDEDDPGPYVIRLGGAVYGLLGPQSLDYKELVGAIVAASSGEPVKSLSILLEESEREAFWRNRIPAFKLEKLLRGWSEHYGIDLHLDDDAGDGDTPGEAGASSPS
jgi:hypothetical protein